MKYKGIRTHYFETGLWTYWYENGKKGSERTYRNGKRDGLDTFWYKNGKKKIYVNEVFPDTFCLQKISYLGARC